MAVVDVKIATMEGVRERTEGNALELWRVDGRTVVRAYNECRNNHTDVDLHDLLSWLWKDGEMSKAAFTPNDLGGVAPANNYTCKICMDTGEFRIEFGEGTWSVYQTRGYKVIIGPAVVRGPCVCRGGGKVLIAERP